jgi:hypothetical protein
VHELLDPIQIAEGVFHRRQGHEHRVARGLVPLLQGEVLTDDAGQIGLPVLPRGRPREIEEVLNRIVGNVVRAGRIRPVEVLQIRELQTELLELRLDVHASLPHLPPSWS